ncbi:MAG TPA: hypothetical protein DIS93_15625 [Bdellovibrionales bacterium]|nr:hypothetical protein [Bdellovibrionales bacterium]
MKAAPRWRHSKWGPSNGNNMDWIKDNISKLPLIPVLIIFCTWCGYDFYEFKTDPGSAFLAKIAEAKTIKETNVKLQDKILIVNEFLKNLEATRVELRNAATKLESFKASVSETLDVAEFARLTTTEARRVGISVVSIRPMEPTKKEYYVEQPFEFAFRGAFVQLVVLLDRLANLQKVVRVDNFEISPAGSSSARIVELQGTMQIKAYRYQGSKADELGKIPGSAPSPTPAGQNMGGA